MNKRIRELALEAGFYADPDVEKFEKFAELIAAAEREACAKECEAFGQTLEVDVGPNFAEAIRARRQRDD